MIIRIIFLFHKNTNKAVKAKVKPPRLDGAKVGVFASRSPHRPNPIGLTLAKLDAIIGNTLLLSAIDLLDGTPVVDIKPYVPDYDKPLNLPVVEDKLELESSDKTLWQNKDFLRCQEPVNQPVPISLGSQLNEQSSVLLMKQTDLDLKPEPTSLSIAEWIRKPPIKELDVKFSDEAVVQISCFHGKKQLQVRSFRNELHGKSDDLSAYKCNCFKIYEEESESLAVKTTNEESKCYKQGNSEAFCSWKQPVESSIKTDDHGNFVKESKLSSHSKPPLNKKFDQAIEDAKGGGLQEELTLEDKRSQAVADPEFLQPSDVCMYQLEMLSSPEEAKQAIVDILKADPRSVYRRNRCQDQLYHLSIDTINVTCKFEESTVEVLRVEPVFYRKLKDSDL